MRRGEAEVVLVVRVEGSLDLFDALLRCFFGLAHQLGIQIDQAVVDAEHLIDKSTETEKVMINGREKSRARTAMLTPRRSAACTWE